MKIQIIGYSGAGKSSLARKIANFYKISSLHLDSVKFYGNWQERTKLEQEKIIKRFLEENENWVIDGNYTSIIPERFIEADLVIFLDFNRFICYNRARKRYKYYYQKVRPDCPCIEKFDWEFKKWLLFSGRTRKRKRKFLSIIKEAKKGIIIKNQKELDNFIKKYLTL